MAGRPAEAQSGKHGKTPLAGLPAEARGGKRGERVGGSNSVVESQPSKLLVAGSIPVSRSNLHSPHDRERRAAVDKPTFAVEGNQPADLSAEARPVRRSAKRAGERAEADVSGRSVCGDR